MSAPENGHADGVSAKVPQKQSCRPRGSMMQMKPKACIVSSFRGTSARKTGLGASATPLWNQRSPASSFVPQADWLAAGRGESQSHDALATDEPGASTLPMLMWQHQACLGGLWSVEVHREASSARQQHRHMHKLFVQVSWRPLAG